MTKCITNVYVDIETYLHFYYFFVVIFKEMPKINNHPMGESGTDVMIF
jgi:hypothetical protein